MLTLILTSLALADPATVRVIVAEQDLTPGESIEESQLYNVDVPRVLAPDSVLNNARSELMNRVPRQVVPKGSMLREAHLFPPGTQPGPEALVSEGYQLVRIEVPGPQILPLPTNIVDVWTESGDAYCLAAKAAVVAAVDSAEGNKLTKLHTWEVTAAWVVVPDGARHWLQSSSKPPVLALRNAIDRDASDERVCGAPAKDEP